MLCTAPQVACFNNAARVFFISVAANRGRYAAVLEPNIQIVIVKMIFHIVNAYLFKFGALKSSLAGPQSLWEFSKLCFIQPEDRPRNRFAGCEFCVRRELAVAVLRTPNPFWTMRTWSLLNEIT
jgi:hypothetical protein